MLESAQAEWENVTTITAGKSPTCMLEKVFTTNNYCTKIFLSPLSHICMVIDCTRVDVETSKCMRKFSQSIAGHQVRVHA